MLKIFFSIFSYSLSILNSQLLNLDELSFSLLFHRCKICLKLSLYLLFGFFFLLLVGLKNFLSEAIAVLNDLLSSQKILSRLVVFFFGFVDFSCIILLDFLNFMLNFLDDVGFGNIQLADRCNFGFVDRVSVLFCDLGNFLLDLLFPNIIFGNFKHSIRSILVEKVIKIVLRMTRSRVKTVSHIQKCFVSLSFTKINILKKN
jgi:hypothetical protein